LRVRVNGGEYWLNPEPTALYHARHSMPKLSRMVTLIGDAKSIFDVGANCGIFAALCAQRFPTAAIHAFEPAEGLQPALAHNCSADNISVHQLAVGERDEVVTLYVHPGSQQANSLQPSAVEVFLEADKIQKETIRCVAVDSFMAEHSITSIDVLKVDVQGWEGPVLRGAQSALSSVRYLFVEASWLDPESVQQLLPAAEHYGFRHVAVVNPVHTGADLLFTREPLVTDMPDILRFPLGAENAGAPWY
jgi:FkbM family methyltransferase